MSKQKLSSGLFSVLQEAVGDSLENYEVKVEDDSTAGDGYLGEMIFITVKNKLNNENTYFIVKQALKATTQRNRDMINSSYFNEIYFYKNIMEDYEKCRKVFSKSIPFNNTPKCYAFATEEDEEKIVMENLRVSGFTLFPRDGHFDHQHTKLLMEIYGRFHGTSAAFREHNPKEFNKHTNTLKNSIETFLGNMEVYINILMKQLVDMIDDENIKEKLKIYTEKGTELATNAVRYNGKNPVVIHGDCWSNNFLFKYEKDGSISDIKFLDFQLCRKGSVTSDLVYFLYCGVRKDILNNLDHYLKIYYDSFCNTLRSYDLDPSKIFTFEDLKNEFKENVAFGFVMSQLLWPTKLRKTTYEKKNLVELTENKLPEASEEKTQMINEELKGLKNIYQELVQHLYDNEYI